VRPAFAREGIDERLPHRGWAGEDAAVDTSRWRVDHRTACGTTASPLATEQEDDRVPDDPEVDEAGLDGADEQVKVHHGGVPAHADLRPHAGPGRVSSQHVLHG